ncbi:MAG: HAD family hydrolase [Planctomycetes bacterium]|nr:HAD family hydrolase [Planctomycetota bacterium]
MLKAVLFDIDGTLGDTMPLCIECFQRAIAAVTGKRVDEKEILARFGPSEEGMLQQMVPDQAEQAVFAYLQHYEQLHGMCPEPFPGVVDMLDYLQGKNVLMGVVTGKGRRSAVITLRQYGLSNYFQAMETGSPFAAIKDIGMKKFMNNHRLSPDEAVYVGDTAADVAEAKKSQIRCFAAAWAESSDRQALRQANPDEIFYSVGELHHRLQELVECADQ